MMTTKIHLYANLLPYNLKLALSFYPTETIGDIHFFIEQTMQKFRVKYKIGRIERKINNVWLLPQYKIAEFLNDQEEINVFSLEYGLTKTKIKAPLNEEEIDAGFIGKKTKRKGEDGLTLGAPTPKSKNSFNLNMKAKTPEKEKNDDSEEEKNNDEDDKEEEKEEEESNDDKEEKNSPEEDEEDDKSEKSEEDEVEEDIAL